MLFWRDDFLVRLLGLVFVGGFCICVDGLFASLVALIVVIGFALLEFVGDCLFVCFILFVYCMFDW